MCDNLHAHGLMGNYPREAFHLSLESQSMTRSDLWAQRIHHRGTTRRNVLSVVSGCQKLLWRLFSRNNFGFECDYC